MGDSHFCSKIQFTRNLRIFSSLITIPKCLFFICIMLAFYIHLFINFFFVHTCKLLPTFLFLQALFPFHFISYFIFLLNLINVFFLFAHNLYALILIVLIRFLSLLSGTPFAVFLYRFLVTSG